MAKLSLPKSVKIGVYDYDIEPLPVDESSKNLGGMNPTDGKIWVSTNHGYRQAATTLDHEIHHAIVSQGNFVSGLVNLVKLMLVSSVDGKDTLEEVEEYIIIGVVEASYGVRRDNPKVFQWISKGIAGG